MLTPLVRKEYSIKHSILFGKYRLVSSLGQGSSSKVFIVEHVKLKVLRAVKCIAKTNTAHPQFFLEADILKNLKHPGIPTIYDVEEDDEAYYIIEEYIQGQSLEAYVLHQDCISIDQVIGIVQQICQVIQYLHNQKQGPILYQDLKPEHIILCGKRVVLIDFGISSYTNGGNTFQNFGTKGYAPPEKYQGISCDVRSDIYGVGKILEFMGTKVQDDAFRFLKPLIWKATAYDKSDRYPSMEALAAELDGVKWNGYQKIQQINNRHLLKEIAVAGVQERVGTTHIAIALTCFIHHPKHPCIYQESHRSDCMRLLIKEDGGRMKNGLAVYGNFQGMPYYSEEVAGWDKAEGLYVQDYGINLHELLAEEDKRLLVVIGSRPWECEKARNLLERVCFRDNLAIVCNYGNKAQAKWMEKTYHHRIYCFPLDADPFGLTREKRKFFKMLLRKERW